MGNMIRLAVVIGGHPYDVPAFREMLHGMNSVDVYIQDLDSWAAQDAESAQRGADSSENYDVVLFYNMNYWDRLSIRDDMDERITGAISRLGSTNQGVVVLHHALLSFNEIPRYSEICNIASRRIRGFGQDDIRTNVAVKDHPITAGIEDWTMPDEFFEMDPPGSDSVVILATDHPGSMKEIGWVHERGKSRVFCYQSGHGVPAYTNLTYRSVLGHGIEWVARRR